MTITPYSRRFFVETRYALPFKRMRSETIKTQIGGCITCSLGKNVTLIPDKRVINTARPRSALERAQVKRVQIEVSVF